MEGKKCRVCSCDLGQDNFSWYRAKNYVWICDNCNRKQKAKDSAKKRKEDPERYTSRDRAYKANLKKNDPLKYTAVQMCSSSKKRAKALNMDHNLDYSFIRSIAPERCPVFGFELKYGGGERTDASPALDRIDSSKGYTKDNVQIISFLANLMKSSASIEQQLLFARWVIQENESKARES